MSLYKWSLSEDEKILASGTEASRSDALQAMQDAIEKEKRKPRTGYWVTAATPAIALLLAILQAKGIEQ